MSDPHTQTTHTKPESKAQPTTPAAKSQQVTTTSNGFADELFFEMKGESDAPPYMILPLWVSVVLLSYVLYKFGKLRVAERVKRWLPMGYVTLWGGGVLASGALLIQTGSLEWLAFGAVALIVMVFLNANWLRSILAGVALTLEHHLEVGDSVRLDGLEGDLVHFGLRSTRLRAVDGTLHDIPHEQLLTQRVANLSGDGSDSACRIGIKIPAGHSIEDAMEVALEVAVLSPLASPRHKPEVFLETTVGGDEPSMLYIRGYAFDPNYQEHFRSDVLKRLSQKFS